MPAEDIESPPYPEAGTTATGLYASLRQLRKWADSYRAAHNKLAGQDLVPALRRLPDAQAYAAQPVMTQLGHLLTLRRVRERWDHLVRTYEDDWDDKDCVRQRILLLTAAAALVNAAFDPHEVREARRRTDLEECQRALDGVAAVLKTLLDPVPDDPFPQAPAG